MNKTVLRAILFTDVVGSTELANEMGNERWTRLLEAHRRTFRDELRANRGREVVTTGDGFFAVFESPADAVRCAFTATRSVQDLGLDIRAGVHFGEIETSGTDAHGIVVNTGARVMGQAGAAEVLVTQTVKDLVAGATFALAMRGTFDLKGVPGTWTLFDVLKVDDELRPAPIEEATVATERRERASAGLAIRRRPRWLIPVAILAVLALGVGGFLALRPKPTFIPTAGTVARIEGDRFDRPVSLGAFPMNLSEGEGRVWVTDRQSQLYWVQEQSGATGSRGTDGVPTAAAVGGGAVWITGGFGGGGGPAATVSRLDPATGQLSVAFDAPIDSQAIAYGAGAVWVADPNTSDVTRYDPVSLSTRAISLPTSDPAPRPDSIAFGDLGGEAIWVGDSLTPTIYRVDASGSNAVRTYTVGGPPSAIAVGNGSIWVASEQADALYALDPGTGALRTTVDLAPAGCNAPVSISLNTQGVWVACSLSQRVVRVDPTGAQQALSLAVQGVPASVTTAQDGSVWVAVEPR